MTCQDNLGHKNWPWFPSYLIFFKGAALLKPLLVWVLWRNRSVPVVGGYWSSAGLRQWGQQPPAARSTMQLCCLCTHQDKFWTDCHPHSAISLESLHCLWLGYSLQGKEFSCTGFLGTSCFVREEKKCTAFVLGGKHKIPEIITPIVWTAGTKCILSLFADGVVYKILISSLVLINFFIYLKATQVATTFRLAG